MKQYLVTGMTCAACQARVEKAVSEVKGVESVSVSLLTNSMGVEGTADDSAIIKAVTDAGYGAEVKGSKNKTSLNQKLKEEEEALKDKTTPILRNRLIVSVIFLIVLMYLSMGHMMWGWPLPGFMAGNHIAMGLMQMILAAIIMVINQRFFISGFKSLMHGSPNMDTLIALGSSAAFIYSTVMLFAMTNAQMAGDEKAVMSYMMEFYYESAGTILTLITVGKMLESYSKGKTTNALKSLMKLAPQTANVIRGEKEETVSSDEVNIGDIFVVRPGETIPVDGRVIEGDAAVNESVLTGESMPVQKAIGDKVSSGTINQSGFIKCEATAVGEDTSLAKIIQMVSDAGATKAPVAKLADKISSVFVPSVIAIAVLTIAIWLIVGRPVGFSLARGICVLVVSCPCALGLATPVAIMVGNGQGARNGILFKTAEALQETGNIEIVALDKTGTITKGKPAVTDVIAENEEELIKYAVTLEYKSEHPLAVAINEYAEKKSIKPEDSSNFENIPGKGIRAEIEEGILVGGNLKFIEEEAELTEDTKGKTEDLAKDGKTPLVFALNRKVIGIIAVADEIKEDSSEAIRELKGQGIRTVMLTGDNEATAKAIGRLSGVDEVIAGVLPDGKEEVIRNLQKQGKVAMVGDGINDAPALTRANIGIAIGAGTDVAIDAASVVLMKSSLKDVSKAIRLSRITYRVIIENLFWAFFYNALLIPLAAGAYVKLGLTMDPMYGAAAMSLSSFCVCMNALRINLIDINSSKHDRQRKHKVQEGEEQETVLEVSGMMCHHCENTVKTAVEGVKGVISARASHEEGKVYITHTNKANMKEVKKVIKSKGYKV